ncbi:MAG: hypothetical protein HY305_05175 [Sphingobacteriales bacterium]|nr:hypothetical protein [Sphingobacteriales bacterium]
MIKDILNKFKFKGATGIIVNAPAAIEQEFTQLGFNNLPDKKTKSCNTVVFVNNYKEYIDFLKNGLKNIERDSVLWFAYPKGKSGIKTDINRDILRVTAEDFGITTVTAISIDDTWSALRFRPIDKVGK